MDIHCDICQVSMPEFSGTVVFLNNRRTYRLCTKCNRKNFR
jgi:hypothetical protein